MIIKFDEICTITRGRRVTKKTVKNNPGIYPVYNGSSNVFGYYDKYNHEGNCLIIVRTGSVGSLIFEENKCWVGDCAYIVEPKKDFIKKYNLNTLTLKKFLYFHFLLNNKELKQLARVGGALQDITSEMLGAYRIDINFLVNCDNKLKVYENVIKIEKNINNNISKMNKLYIKLLKLLKQNV